jgi:hypothetical protein
VDAAIFDVTPVSTTAAGKELPNPNVMIELGYAIGKNGVDPLAMVMNTAHGEPKDLPFDIRNRMVIRFHCGSTDEVKAARAKLTRDLIDVIKALLAQRAPKIEVPVPLELEVLQPCAYSEERRFAIVDVRLVNRADRPTTIKSVELLIGGAVFTPGRRPFGIQTAAQWFSTTENIRLDDGGACEGAWFFSGMTLNGTTKATLRITPVLGSPLEVPVEIHLLADLRQGERRP